ncbi:MAG: hypothetical protein IPP78_00115 [Holophagaceae bacterium]|nr:hypothetical protein [Holophagaceae bacterium]
MADYLKWIYDLHVLGQRFRELEWEHLVSVCLEKKLCGTCLHGMQSAIEIFHTSVPDGVRGRLSKGALKEPIDMGRMQSWLYLQRMNLRGLPGLWLKARWLRQRLLPSGGYLRHYYGKDQRRLMAFPRYLRKGFSHLWE